MDSYISSPTTSTFDESPNQPLDSQASEPRKLRLKCTTCNKEFITKVEAFQSCNLVKHYRENHPSIAYNKETENAKKDSPSISRRGVKTLLNTTFSRALTTFNNDLKRNIDTSGTLSLTFELWTSRNQDTYIGIILSFIDTDFDLVYKLINFGFITESYTGKYVYTSFVKAIKPYLFITLKNILSTSNHTQYY
ncbi:hypothetical protein GcM1_136001 [Golovinomyces cichoracearum]|uniref:Uncharacterized protein n=1 Tax=Golovinomyces cichoracearum TaxID=62708 RepID=A0A420JBQ0_9PEZI|nr:hypothetical protein GcM1_136001 [Golovinomyces cichoracearum]